MKIWVFSNQFFTSLDIATQSLFAFYAGRDDRAAATAVFRRTLSLALLAGVVVCVALLARRAAVPSLFRCGPEGNSRWGKLESCGGSRERACQYGGGSCVGAWGRVGVG